MRDPKRIDEMLSVLRSIWELSPDLRLGQLIVNASRPNEPCPQIFYIEDDKLLNGLVSYKNLLSAPRKT